MTLFHEWSLTCPHCNGKNTEPLDIFDLDLDEGSTDWTAAKCPDCDKGFLAKREVEIEYSSCTYEESED